MILTLIVKLAIKHHKIKEFLKFHEIHGQKHSK
jgi:hypothetical protein